MMIPKSLLPAILFLFLFGISAGAFACGFPPGSLGYFRLFQPEKRMLSQFHGFAYFHSEADKAAYKGKDYGSYGGQDIQLAREAQQRANILSWKYFLGRDVEEDNIRNVIYGTALQRYVSHGSTVNSKNLHPLIRRWSKPENQDEIAYIQYAKDCESYCQGDGNWGSNPSSNAELPPHIRDLINTGKSGYAATKKPFLKLRYAYQILRLAQYHGACKEAISLYETYARPVLSASKEIGGWVTGNYAGCLRHEKRYAEAAYAFSREYALAPSRRIDARWGWQINTDRQWQQLMKLCKNDHEKADNHALRALSFYAIPQEDMKAMQQLDPGREDLDLILIHEIRNLEIELLGPVDFGSVPFEERLRNPNYAPHAKKRLQQIDAIVVDGLEQHQCFDSTLWQLAHVYLQFLNGNYDESQASLNAYLPQLKGEDLLRAKKMELEMELVTTDFVTADMESRLAASSLKKFGWSEEQLEEFLSFRDNALFWKYMDQGNEMKATLMRDVGDLLERYGVRSSMIDSIFALDRKPGKTPLEKEMIHNLWHGKPHDTYWISEGVTEAKLQEIKGTSLMVEGKFAQAVQVFQALPSVGMTESDPFQPHIKIDDHNKSIWGPSELYDKLGFATKLQSLRKAIQTKDGRTFHNYMQLGNAYLNTLHAHPAAQLICYQRWSGWHYGYEKAFLKPYSILGHRGKLWPRNIDVAPAKRYYRLAIQATQDPDSQALAYYMLARCERMQNAWVSKIVEENFCRQAEESRLPSDVYWKRRQAIGEKYAERETILPSFSILRDRYADTWMVDYLIQECADFRYFCAH